MVEMPRSRKRFGSVLLLVWAFLFFALPALVGLCADSPNKMASHDCCGAKVLCHQQIQPQPCCETQGSAPPAASPLLSLSAGLAMVALAPLSDLSSIALRHWLYSAAGATAQADLFLLKHSFLC
jgi:hypothetical protein